MSEGANPKWVLYAYAVVMALAVAYFVVLIAQALASPQGVPGLTKPCQGCTDADLGLVDDPSGPSQAPGKGA